MTTEENTGVAISARSRPHTAGAGLAERTSAVAGDILKAIAVTVEAVLDDTLAALPQITQTRFVFEIANDGKSRRIWPLGRPASADQRATEGTAQDQRDGSSSSLHDKKAPPGSSAKSLQARKRDVE